MGANCIYAASNCVAGIYVKMRKIIDKSILSVYNIGMRSAEASIRVPNSGGGEGLLPLQTAE